MKYLITAIAFVFAISPTAVPAEPLIQNAITIQQDRIVFRLSAADSLTGIIKVDQQLEDGLRGLAGPLDGVPGSFALLSEGDRLSARIHARDRVFLFEPLPGGHRVTPVDPPPFACAAQRAAHQPQPGMVSAPAIAGPCDHLTSRSGDPCFAAEQAMAAAAASVNSCHRLPHAYEPVDIKIVVFYTPSVASAHSWSVIRQEVYFGILETNASFAVSQVPATVSLARRKAQPRGCIFRSDSDETGILNDDLEALLTSMPEVPQKRDLCRADLVVLLTETSDASGIACVMKTRTVAFAPYAMAIVRFRSLVHHYTFTHEIGHLMGGGHDRRTQNEIDNNCRMGMCNESAGWHFSHAGIEYKSMMAYGGEKSLHFSDPRIRFEGGPRTGTATANNAQTLRRTARTVSEFRP